MFKTVIKEISTEIDTDRGEVVAATFMGDKTAWIMALNMLDAWDYNVPALLENTSLFDRTRWTLTLREYRMLGGSDDRDEVYVAKTIAGYLHAIDAIKILGAPGIPLLESVTTR